MLLICNTKDVEEFKYNIVFSNYRSSFESQEGYCSMNTDLVLMFGALILLAISGLLVFCFTESKGKNTPYARRRNGTKVQTQVQTQVQTKRVAKNTDTRNIVTH